MHSHTRMRQIKDFQSEPADDAATAAKFKLYEAFAETVSERLPMDAHLIR